jgi:hypothetical protein
MDVGLVLLFLVIAGAVAWYRWHKAAERREALFGLANRNGLTYSRRDPLHLLGLGFERFREGDDQGIENVVHGTYRDRPFTVFDLWSMTEHTDSEGKRSRSYRYYSGAVRELDGVFCPHMVVKKENILTRAKDKVGFRDIEFESGEFNAMFEVGCDDRRFASTFIDPRMMEWLLSTKGRFAFEVRGRHLLVTSGRVKDPNEFLILHGVMNLFEDRIPDVAKSLYPGG